MFSMRSVFFSADRIAILLLAFLTLIAALTFRDYGLGWDDVTHSQYGDLLLKLYGSGFADTRALSFVNLYKYGGGFDMAAALVAKVLPFDLFETRRLVGAAIGLIGLIATWRMGRRLGGPIAGLVALALLVVCPIYYGHMFMNPKDAPFAAAMAVLLLGLVRAFDEYPQPNARTVALTGIGLGLAFGTRVLAGVLAPSALAALVLMVLVEGRGGDWRAAFKRCGQFIAMLLPALGLGYLIMGLLWPWSIQSLLNPLHAAEYFDTFFEKPWQELYRGQLIDVTAMPPIYLPHLFILKLPEIMIALGLTGTAGAFVVAASGKAPPQRRAAFLLVALAAFFPIVLAMAARPALYNGVRHFIFVIPPFAALGGPAAAWIGVHMRTQGKAALAGLAAMFLAGVAMPVIDMVRLHPYQYSVFNWASGGVRAAHDNYMLDYWGLAFKQAGEELRHRLALSAEKPPAGRKWVVAICGPQASAQEELGPQFETTFDRKTADFALALGTFYCRHLQHSIMAEIEREGVVYATVYDLRGGPTPNLLTRPPP
jgi:dolichyl-phosphate-mannose-protein mannosyltransferase